MNFEKLGLKEGDVRWLVVGNKIVEADYIGMFKGYPVFGEYGLKFHVIKSINYIYENKMDAKRMLIENMLCEIDILQQDIK